MCARIVHALVEAGHRGLLHPDAATWWQRPSGCKARNLVLEGGPRKLG